MTPVGHSLVGASLGIVSLPEFRSRRARVLFIAGFVALAGVPDFPLPFWGHGAYYGVSHSLLVNSILIAAAAACLRLWPRTRATLGSWPVLAAGAAAWLSHLLLDSFYNHGQGIRIFWPFSSDAALALPIPWFASLDGHIWEISAWKINAHNLRIYSIELVSCLPLVLLAILLRRMGAGRRHGPGPV